MDTTLAALRQRYEALSPHLSERALRIWAASEAKALGRGGLSRVHEVTQIAISTIRQGIEDLEQPPLPEGRQRAEGGGRNKAEENDPTLLSDLDALMDPLTRGDPESPLRWSAKSTEKIAEALREKGHKVSQKLVRRLLLERDYSLQSTKKRFEGNQHPDREAQFQHIAQEVQRFQAQGQPVISVDAKKKELIGNFAQKGQEWQKKGTPLEVEAYDFRHLAEAKATPYGIYDLFRNEGWVSVGIDHDTAEFAVASIERWWLEMGVLAYPEATDLLITADGGGSNGSRLRLWKQQLQAFADRRGLTVSVCHFPPGTSKWNKIEHRLFSFISKNWRGQPLSSLAVIVSLIGNTRTETGLTVQAALDEKSYALGIRVTDEEMEQLQLLCDAFHGEWNYSLVPSSP